MSPAQRGVRLLLGLGYEQKLANMVAGEVLRWQPYGCLDDDDWWAIAIRTVWDVRSAQPDLPAPLVCGRVRWQLLKALEAEYRVKGWRRQSRGGVWEPPRPPMARPEWDWGRPFHLKVA